MGRLSASTERRRAVIGPPEVTPAPCPRVQAQLQRAGRLYPAPGRAPYRDWTSWRRRCRAAPAQPPGYRPVTGRAGGRRDAAAASVPGCGRRRGRRRGTRRNPPEPQAGRSRGDRGGRRARRAAPRPGYHGTGATSRRSLRDAAAGSRLGARRSGRELRAPLGAPAGEDRTPRTGAHPQAEPVGLGPAAVVGLERTLAHSWAPGLKAFGVQV